MRLILLVRACMQERASEEKNYIPVSESQQPHNAKQSRGRRCGSSAQHHNPDCSMTLFLLATSRCVCSLSKTFTECLITYKYHTLRSSGMYPKFGCFIIHTNVHQHYAGWLLKMLFQLRWLKFLADNHSIQNYRFTSTRFFFDLKQAVEHITR